MKAVGCALALAAIALASDAQAEIWYGAGWYVVRLDSGENIEALTGPYDDRQTCEKMRGVASRDPPPVQSFRGFDCRYLSRSPPSRRATEGAVMVFRWRSLLPEP